MGLSEIPNHEFECARTFHCGDAGQAIRVQGQPVAALGSERVSRPDGVARAEDSGLIHSALVSPRLATDALRPRPAPDENCTNRSAVPATPRARSS